VKNNIKKILDIHLKDNVKAREMQADGSYIRVQPQADEERIDAQAWMLKHRGFWHQAEATTSNTN